MNKKKKRLCPNYKYFFEPTLKALDYLNGSGTNQEIYDKVISITNLSSDIIEEMHSFTLTEVEYQLAWARTYLKNYGAIISSRQGVWALTAKGKSLIKDNNIDVKDITRFSSRKKNETSDDIITEEKKNWIEQISYKT